MQTLEHKPAPFAAIETTPDAAIRADERRDLFMPALPMIVTFGLWLLMQVWLVGPLLFR